MNIVHPGIDSLDSIRRRALGFALRTPLAWLLVDRGRRVGAQATVGVMITFCLTLLAPMSLVSVSPALFGVPHVASDIRYLVLRRNLPAWWKQTALVACAALIALRVVEGIVQWDLAPIEIVIVAAWLAIAARSRPRLLAGVVVIGGVALLNPQLARIVFAHLHNVIALAVWVMMFRRPRRAALLPLVLAGAATLILLFGSTHAPPALGMSIERLAETLLPGAPPNIAAKLALAFVFLQGVHYAVWLGWIPQEDVKGQGTTTFRMSLRTARTDFGRAGLTVIALLSSLMLVGSALDLHLARAAYLSVATFHGYLELATLLFMVP